MICHEVNSGAVPISTASPLVPIRVDHEVGPGVFAHPVDDSRAQAVDVVGGHALREGKQLSHVLGHCDLERRRRGRWRWRGRGTQRMHLGLNAEIVRKIAAMRHPSAHKDMMDAESGH